MNIMGGIIYTYVKQKEKGRVRRGGSIDEMEAGRKSGKNDFGIRDEDQNNYQDGLILSIGKQLTQKMNAQVMIPKNTCNPDYDWCW